MSIPPGGTSLVALLLSAVSLVGVVYTLGYKGAKLDSRLASLEAAVKDLPALLILVATMKVTLDMLKTFYIDDAVRANIRAGRLAEHSAVVPTNPVPPAVIQATLGAINSGYLERYNKLLATPLPADDGDAIILIASVLGLDMIKERSRHFNMSNAEYLTMCLVRKRQVKEG